MLRRRAPQPATAEPPRITTSPRNPDLANQQLLWSSPLAQNREGDRAPDLDWARRYRRMIASERGHTEPVTGEDPGAWCAAWGRATGCRIADSGWNRKAVGFTRHRGMHGTACNGGFRSCVAGWLARTPLRPGLESLDGAPAGADHNSRRADDDGATLRSEALRGRTKL